MIPRRLPAPLTLLLLGVPALLPGQAKDTVPPRPPLASDADTNSAVAYYALGVAQLPDHPQRAAAAFFWATRLDPANGAAWYGRWAARMLDPDRPPPGSFALGGLVEIRDPDRQDPDSLRSKALLRDPLLYVRFDFDVGDELMRRTAQVALSLHETSDPVLRGWIDYAAGRFASAARDYAEGVRAHPGDYGLHLARARTFMLASQYDSAISEMGLFLAGRAHYIEHDPVGPDQSLLLGRYALARLEALKGDTDAALRAYAAVLASDSGFGRAHVELARLALARHDTALALREYGWGVTVGDPAVWYEYGMLLLRARRPADAALQFERAIQADSDYVAPYLPLALLEEKAGFEAEAVPLYARFIAEAPRSQAGAVTVARGRVGRLRPAR